MDLKSYLLSQFQKGQKEASYKAFNIQLHLLISLFSPFYYKNILNKSHNLTKFRVGQAKW